MAVRTCGVMLLLCTLVSAQTEDSWVVQTQQGAVRGYRSSQGDSFDFFGIPYATAPIGRDKFKEAGPPPTWAETFEATNDLIMCDQPFFSNEQDSNCLVVNVHVPANQEGPLPVMYYVHGGGLTQGYGAMTSPEWILQHNVIVVTVNYRLGVLGFLCMNTENIPGNAGFKDQVAGLRWVNQNIASFGGNPNDVTIAGFSAGSISVEYLMLSPMANGLFHKVISESASVLAPFSEARKPIEFAKRFVSALAERTIDDVSEAENYLLDATSASFLTVELEGGTDLDTGIALCVEKEILGFESFLTEPPLNIMNNGNYNKVPYMTGIASEEGTLFLSLFDDHIPKMEENFADFLPVGLNFGSENEKNEVASRVKRFYFNDQPVSYDTIRGYVDFITDITFGYPLLRSAKIHAQNSVPVYLYMYSYVVSEYPSHPHDDKIRGAIHCAQSFCVNKILWLHQPSNETPNDLLMRDRLTKMWTDFAKHGVPVTETTSLLPAMWQPMDADSMNYLRMDVETVMGDHLLGDRYKLWDEIYQQYYGEQPETSRVVQIQQGAVRGYRSSQGDIFDFFGIPYATAPTGRDKFKTAGPPPTWPDTFEATNDMIMCEQPFFVTQHNGNCLVINIHVPANQEGPLPVMFYIHGGGFTQGYGAMTYPQWLLEQDVIVVTINYRLGALGFLCMLTESIPGNAAYKDQVAGLRWVKQNIASFGGNPNDVTIVGYSAGSISVEYLMLSPMATGLFHKAISESGSVLTPFSEGREPIEFAKRFVSDSLQENITDFSQVENYLLNAPSSSLVTERYDEYQYRTDFSMGLTFCVEQEIEGVESFLTEKPLTVLESGNYNKVPYMTGIASEEGSIMLPYFDEWKIKMENDFADFIPVGLHFRNPNERNDVARRIKQFYFSDQPVTDATIRGYVDFTSDATFGYSLLRSARLHALNSVPVYLYIYSYVVSEYPSHPHDDKIRGAIHCAQSFCVNKILWLHQPMNESPNDLLMRDRLTKMWSDFAKHGVPVTETTSLLPAMWQPMDADNMNYLRMDVETVMGDHLLGDRYKLWDEIYQQYYGEQPEPSRVVQIQQGSVRGYRSSQGDFFDFFGIPYATAPTGRDKFKAAGPPPTWPDTFEATNDMIMCEQPFFVSQHNGNCLVINIHVPANHEGPLPVMFYIHGGGFTQGYGAMTYPQWLLEQDVIVVTINYRLGALGFLCMLTENIPGNAAYKDQVAGLRWVNQNIASFGGNPNDVTIVGYSAGSISVEYLMLSPMATGLFHKAISESGSVLTPFSEGREPIEFAKRFVSDSLQQTITDFSRVENYLLNAPSSSLVTERYDEYQYQTDFSMGLTFCVEQEIEGVESFLTERPLTVLESGNYNKVPYMTGIASEEGSIMLPYFDEWKIKMENDFADFIPVGLHFRNQNERNDVARRLKQLYFNDQPVTDATIRGYVDFTSDATFGYSLLRSARLHALNSVPVYLYIYSYVVSEYPSHPHDDKIRGAIHCAQSFCVNKILWLHEPSNESSNDLLMRDRLTKLWSDFAKHGVPVTETSSLLPVMWERMDADRMNYMQMDETMTASDHLLQERYQLWNDIYEQFYGGSASVITYSFAVMFSIVFSVLMNIV